MEVSIPHEERQIMGMFNPPAAAHLRDKQLGVIMTHGAGGDLHTSQVEGFAHALANAGFLVLRFTCKGLNIVYRTKVYHSVLVIYACYHCTGLEVLNLYVCIVQYVVTVLLFIALVTNSNLINLSTISH